MNRSAPTTMNESSCRRAPITLNELRKEVIVAEATNRKPVGRPTRFPGKAYKHRLTVSLTPACREHIDSLARRMSCSLSDVVEYSVWQTLPTTITSTGGNK
jgi:hypothetical protein